jgi:hypothetical protein
VLHGRLEVIIVIVEKAEPDFALGVVMAIDKLDLIQGPELLEELDDLGLLLPERQDAYEDLPLLAEFLLPHRCLLLLLWLWLRWRLLDWDGRRQWGEFAPDL